MKVEEKMIKQLTIKDVKGLDPVRVIVEEFDRGQAKVIIECYGESWSSYWGSMGGNLKEFFTRTNVDYLVNCFDRGIRGTTGELDLGSMKETFIKCVRERVIERVKDGWTKSPSNRDVYNECEDVNLSAIQPQHPYDTWCMDHYSMTEDSWKEVFGDEDEFSEWMADNVPDQYEVNHDYAYLSRIIETVREVIIK